MINNHIRDLWLSVTLYNVKSHVKYIPSKFATIVDARNNLCQ